MRFVVFIPVYLCVQDLDFVLIRMIEKDLEFFPVFGKKMFYEEAVA